MSIKDDFGSIRSSWCIFFLLCLIFLSLHNYMHLSFVLKWISLRANHLLRETKAGQCSPSPLLLHFPWLIYIKFIFILQSEHDGSDVQVHLNVEHPPEADILPNMTRSPRVKYITYFEDSESLPGKRTAVWELDKGISNIVPFEF